VSYFMGAGPWPNVRKEIERDMTIGRADQILTGDLFSLDSTLALGEDGEAMQAEYERLLAKSQRSAAEEERHAELGRRLVERIPPAGAENKLERRSQELVRAVLTADYRPDRVEDLGRMLAGKANAVLASMGWTAPAAPAHDADLDGGARR
jgi:hypothetical protein